MEAAREPTTQILHFAVAQGKATQPFRSCQPLCTLQSSHLRLTPHVTQPHTFHPQVTCCKSHVKQQAAFLSYLAHD